MRVREEINLGVMYRREHAPEHLPGCARRAEEVGFDELWVVEDCFYGSGIASAATALACTDSITVGLGIMPAVVRNPVRLSVSFLMEMILMLMSSDLFRPPHYAAAA